MASDPKLFGSEMELVNALLKAVANRQGNLRSNEPSLPPTGDIWNQPNLENRMFREAIARGEALSAPIPGANPEVSTPRDALVGTLLGIAPMGNVLGRTPGGGSETVRPGGRIRPDATGYVGPLSEKISGKLYRDTSIEGLLADMMGPKTSINTPAVDLFSATNRDLARGQKGNTGVMVEIDPRGLQGQVSTKKPSSQFMLGSGHGEVLLKYNSPQQIYESVRSFTINPSAKSTRLERRQALNLMRQLESEGWIKTTSPDGGIKMARPK